MGEEEPASLEGQFFEFSKMMDKKRDGTTITLYNSDFWMRQCKLLDDRKLTMTDTGILFNKFRYDFDLILFFKLDLLFNIQELFNGVINDIKCKI